MAHNIKKVMFKSLEKKYVFFESIADILHCLALRDALLVIFYGEYNSGRAGNPLR